MLGFRRERFLVSLKTSLAFSADRSYIGDASELVCGDFDDRCRWRNEIGKDGKPAVDELDWGRGKGRPDLTRTGLIFGTYTQPGR